MEQVDKETQNEIAIVTRIVQDALASGYTVSLYDDIYGGGEWTVKRTTQLNDILNAINTTGGDILRFRNAQGDVIGSVSLIYGNGNDGCHLISDYTSSEAMIKLMAGAEDLSNQLEGD